MLHDRKDIMLVPHSYGGIPGCQAVSGLEKRKREAEEKPGGVVHVLFIVALLVEQGGEIVTALEGARHRLGPFSR